MDINKFFFIISFIMFGLAIFVSSQTYPSLIGWGREHTLYEVIPDTVHLIGNMSFYSFTIFSILWSTLILFPVWCIGYSIRLFKEYS